jgi:PAS domain S-box-containing protein
MSVGNPEKPDGVLRANDHGVRPIIDATPVLACTLSPQFEIELLSPSLLDYFGLTRDELKKWPSISVVHPDDLDAVVARTSHSAQVGEPFDFEHRSRRYDGVFRRLHARGLPLRNPEARIERWYVLLIDVEDQRQADDAVRATEQELRAAINAIPTPAWSTRPDGHVDFLNQRWLEYAGLTAEQALGWGWGTSIHPDDRANLVQQWQLCLASGMGAEAEARHRRFDGVYRWFLVRANPLRDESGNVIKWYGINIDIEDRKRAEDTVRGNEQTLRSTINAIPTTAWSTRPDGYCEFLNQRWLDYAGMTAEQAQGWGWGAAIHPEDVDRLVKYWQSCLDSGTPVEVEARMRRFDGVYRWFLFRANPLRDESGKIVRWYGTNIDIEDRKKAEEVSQSNERTLQMIVNTIPALAWSSRPDGYVTFLNQRWLDYAGITAEQGKGWGWTAALHPDEASRLADYWQATLATGQLGEIEARLRRFDGTYRWFLFRATALRDSSGNIAAWYGFNTDIDDRKRAEEALTRSRSELAHIARVMSLGILTASIAHEVNQPLAGIITNAETCLQMLDDNPPDIEGARETALRSIRDGNRASDVIARLRSLFKRKESVAESIDLNDATREVIALSSAELRRSRVVLQMELADDLPLVNGDRVQLQQVIVNLLRNAIDAMREIEDRPRQLQIQTEKDGAGNVRLLMQDTGVGFAPGSADRLFESFYSTKDDGMGIGLAISRSIIEAHHGQIWAASNHGHGSTFAFSIPPGSIPHGSSLS